MKEHNVIKIYVISNIASCRHEYINFFSSHLDERFCVFNPYLLNQYNIINSKIEYKVFLKDKLEIDLSDISIVLLPLYGRDCASEIGYANGLGKCIIGYIDKMETDIDINWLDDWMVKGFIDYIITTDRDSYKKMKENPFFHQEENYKNKITIHYIEKISNISEKIEDLYKCFKNQV